MDPFCGRGNGPFTAAVMGRPTTGIDVNPVAWIFTAAKLQPAEDPEQVIARLNEIWLARKPQDGRSRSQFEAMAWAPKVRALLRAARRELDWKGSEVDRTLMAFIALHMQDKKEDGLSNSMSPTIAYSPDYAVRWWTDKGLLRPPDVDPVAMLTDKIRRRYHYGIPDQAQGTAILGDARDELPKQAGMEAGLLITSPPYCGVADYWNDHWLRLWLLGHNFRKDWRRSARYKNKTDYETLIGSVLQEASRHLKKGAAVLIRTDQRRQTAKMCIAAVQETWPNRKLLIRSTTAPHKSISVHHGRGGQTAKEIDLLLPGKRGRNWWEKQGFQPVKLAGDYVGQTTAPVSQRLTVAVATGRRCQPVD
ncbi:MAG: hypothetical protein OXC09_05645 [Truepera sp.]|nr:hypothetical protein [Truepera sp.]